MAKNKDNTDTVNEVEVTAPAVVAPPQVQLKLISFEQYCALKKILPHHMPGMRAFCSNPNKSRPLVTWEALFATY